MFLGDAGRYGDLASCDDFLPRDPAIALRDDLHGHGLRRVVLHDLVGKPLC